MTVAANASSVEYLENGVTVSFPVPFRFIAPNTLQVTRIGTDGAVTTLAYGSQWNATGGSTDAGGTLTLIVPSVSGARLRINRATPRAQQADYTTNDTFPAESHEGALDKSMLINQEQDSRIDNTAARALMVPDGETVQEIPPTADRAGQFLGFDVLGRPVSLSGTGADAGLRQDLANPSIGTSLVAWRQAGAGTVPRDTDGKLLEIALSPKDFGAVGDGVADDGPALNLLFARVRTLLATASDLALCVHGGNSRYRTTESIDVTGLAAWSLKVRDMQVIGECTGKAVFDLINTRGYAFHNVTVWGDKTNRPAAGIQAQRGTTNGFCDNASFKDCNLDGWFSRAAVHDYGQETTQWDHCTIFNRDHTARVAIHEGYDSHPMTSDYASVMTGGTSFINKQFLNCDYRYLPADENIAAVTGITNAADAVVTAPGHAFEIGDQVVFQYVAGMPLMATVIATVTAADATTFTIDTDTTALGTFGGSGNAIRRAVSSPLYIARTEGFAMKDCYVVSYGQPPIELSFPDAGFQRLEQIEFSKLLCEGAGQRSVIAFNATMPCTVLGFTLTTYNTHCSDELLTNMDEDGSLSFFGFNVEVFDPLFTINLVSSPAHFAAYGADVQFLSAALVDPVNWATFNGQITAQNDGKNTLYMGGNIVLNANRTVFGGTFGGGAATPTLGSNKPGSGGAPVTWVDIKLDGTDYCFPVWAKS